MFNIGVPEGETKLMFAFSSLFMYLLQYDEYLSR